MRKIVLGLGTTIDGCIVRRGGAVDFLIMPKDYSMASFFKSIDTAILGRKTMDVALAMGGGSFGSMKSYVLSRTRAPGERDGVTYTNQDPGELVAEIRKQRGKDIWLMGGGEVAREFLMLDLVDEMRLGIVPVLLGEGIPLFPPGFPQRDFVLKESRSYSRGLIGLRYARRRGRGR